MKFLNLCFLAILLFAAMQTTNAKFKKKTHLKSMQSPNSISSLRLLVNPAEKRLYMNESDLQKFPEDYNVISPFSEEQDRILNPRNVYNKDPKEYNLNAANLSDIKSDQIYLVKNLTALNEVKGFRNSAKTPRRDTPPINSKDPSAYYNPVGTINNIYKPLRKNLYSTPIELWRNGSLSFEEEKETKAKRQALLHNTNDYYDPTYNPLQPKEDNLVKVLKKAAKKRLAPKSEDYDSFIKKEKLRKKTIEHILNKKEAFGFEKDHALEQALRVEARKRLGCNNKEKFKQKKGDQVPYYDATRAAN